VIFTGDNPLRDAHARLVDAVRGAYRMPEEADPLAFLLELNLAGCQRKKLAKNHSTGFATAPRRASELYHRRLH
jgi:hypothetical protein